MAASKDIDGSVSVPAFYGKELRWRREGAGLTLQQAVEGSFYGVSYLSEIEHGRRRMPLDLAQHVDRVLRADGFFERRCEDVRKARTIGQAKYAERVLEAEQLAETIDEWCPIVLPGVLQTEAYMRALFRAERPLEPLDETDVKVNARLGRARLFEDDQRAAEYWVILHESLLRLPVLPPEGMADQLDRVTTLGRRRRVVPQILPWNAGAHPFMSAGTVLILTFGDAPPLVYTESLHSGVTIDDPAIVKRYRRSYDLLRAAALPPEVSLAMIEAAAEDFRNGKQTR
ncbi:MULTISPECIES: helix-turn-helix transcriptional regulator [unclassified Streptomyces]|uniref:helix-turn-helix domain-containing protein n=1 Tax=unclassified Streptomyces TaxID=2593676 RepID=UPI000DC7AC71|nr:MULTISPECIES: helix-turn-helix transcriptional regulator [unclassified Streptomyces]AWZ05663.1 XRE family transcriptional regulator [Streptomyces sp. ICC4]AWZ13358.1 XRE family transcriptional regulator [Streptomyces sp. ICC1]